MKRRVGRGSLVLIALLFACSGALRIGDGIGSALAEAKGAKEADAEMDNGGAEAAAEGHESAEGTSEGNAVCPPTPAELAGSLLEREGRLASQEAAIADREAALALAGLKAPQDPPGRRPAMLCGFGPESFLCRYDQDWASVPPIARNNASARPIPPLSVIILACSWRRNEANCSSP